MEAWIGLFGVIVGSLLTASVGYLFKRQELEFLRGETDRRDRKNDLRNTHRSVVECSDGATILILEMNTLRHSATGTPENLEQFTKCLQNFMQLTSKVSSNLRLFGAELLPDWEACLLTAKTLLQQGSLVSIGQFETDNAMPAHNDFRTKCAALLSKLEKIPGI